METYLWWLWVEDRFPWRWEKPIARWCLKECNDDQSIKDDWTLQYLRPWDRPLMFWWWGATGRYLLKSLSPHKFYLVLASPIFLLCYLIRLGGTLDFNGYSHDRACIIVKRLPKHHVGWRENESKLLLKRWDVQGPKKYFVVQKNPGRQDLASLTSKHFRKGPMRNQTTCCVTIPECWMW